MATLEINGRRVQVDDSFRSLSPEQQQATVEEIAASMGAATQKTADYRGEGGGRGTRAEAFGIGLRQGVTLGFGDEINAGVRAAGDALFRGKPLGEAYDARLEHERGLLGQTREENPASMLAGEIGGAVMLPGGAVKGATVAGTAAKAGLAAGTFGAVSGFANEEGGFAERAKGAGEGAAFGALFGAGTSAAIGLGTRAFQRSYDAAMRRPTVENLRRARTVAYKAVEDSGEVFAPTEVQAMAARARSAVEDGLDYVPEVDAQTRAALEMLDRVSNRELTMGQLDKVRQGLWKRANAAPNEVGIMEAIDAVDDLIASRAETSDLMKAARAAHSQFKKAELLERAFKKAEDQTSSTGSSGNIQNKYRQAVTSIVNNPKQAKHFAPEELATMQKVIEGSLPENVMRRVGKMAPGGNGLMLFLNLAGASAMGPGFLAATATAQGAKVASDSMATRSVGTLFDQVAGRTPTASGPVSIPGGVNALTGYLGGR